VIGVLAGGDLPLELLRKWVESAEILVAADGAGNRILEVGATPNWVVGDMDSASTELLASSTVIVKNIDQNYTDCDKLLLFLSERKLLPVTITGLEGNRVDHLLSSIYSVGRVAFRDQITLAFRRSLGWVLGPGQHEKRCAPDRRVSLLPISACKNVTATGLRWPITGQNLEAGTSWSISNLSEGDGFSISLEEGLLLVTAEHASEEFPIW
jgi:thiamine pyrophosphokinase